ncbi:cellulose biosynthesis protein BcsQ [Saccharothrix ecbatanensis]|uniref:Cellulose biosynthesis protein BcsQ n=1 Tax=Saccharothrix ecbatanensis TaxID=1105145 RepID=A0A7W9HJJ4_9PSEU|nr:caspase family protein [Saccharothrix ecbatanensis]MBB5803300.1 cellulose biosynthesis protein BcsQ [Saccharothrix ecbatanensis]
MPHALVVGINTYSGKGVPELKYAVNDAVEVSDRLRKAGFDVVTLTDRQATHKKIHWELEVGLNQRVTDEDDPVVIYWSGHGMSDLRKRTGGDGASTFLLPVDADIDQPLGTSFPVQHVWALLNRLKTRRVLVMLDTCFSGAFAGDGRRGFAIDGARGGAVNPTDEFLRMEGHGRIVVSACGPDEIAREDETHGHGHFSRSVLTVLDRSTSDRHVNVTGLVSDIRAEVRRQTRGEQTPSMHVSFEGADWRIPLPPPAPYQAPMPSWAFVGTSGGVGKTTLAMITAELLAESGNTVLYLDADIAHHGGTSEWCQRAGTDLGHAKTFADHVAAFSRAKTRTPAAQLSDRLVDVTPGYLRRHGCGRILLLPAARVSDRLFVFDLVAEIKDRRSNVVCRQILDEAFERGVRQGATCVVIDCGAQFDPLAVNSIAAVDHPFVVAAARAGAKEQRETILSNCERTVDGFSRLRVATVVNRVPSEEALVQHWGQPGYSNPGMSFHFLPFDSKLFQDWEEGRPNFELGYDDLTHQWHEILVASDKSGCQGEHKDFLPSEWNRFSKWSLWLAANRDWTESKRATLSRSVRRSYVVAVCWFAILATALVSILPHVIAKDDADDASFLPQWLSIPLLALSALAVAGNAIVRMVLRRRRRVLNDVLQHSTSVEALKDWFSVPREDGAWWQVWRSSRRVAIEWLHEQVKAERGKQLPSGRVSEAAT